MLVQSKLFRMLTLSIILFTVGIISCLQAEDEKKSQPTNPAMQSMTPEMQKSMMNPHMMSPMMNPMMGMMGPMMNPMMGMMGQ